MTLPHIQLLSRRDCCLCEDAKLVVSALEQQGLCSWEIVNVDHDKTLLIRYGMDVPVLFMDGKELFRHRVTEDALKSILVEISTCVTV